MGIWKTGIWRFAAAALLALCAAAWPGSGQRDYQSVVEQFATAPHDAVERMLSMPPDDVARAVREASLGNSGWTAAALNRALLMHGDAAIALRKDRGAAVSRQIELADQLAFAAARHPGNIWFVHRWYRAFTATVHAQIVEAHWRQQPWYKRAASVDRAGELEVIGAHLRLPVDTLSIDAPGFREATQLLEPASADGFVAASLHLGRIQLLRGHDADARRLLTVAAGDEDSRVTRYLAHLFLGSMDERDGRPDAAERHYRDALTALPRAQSGHVALASLFARTGRSADAALAIVNDGAPRFFDPWWSYFDQGPREAPVLLAELHSEVCE